MILILVRFMLARFMDLPALACTSNLHEPHQNKNHSLNDLAMNWQLSFSITSVHLTGRHNACTK